LSPLRSGSLEVPRRSRRLAGHDCGTVVGGGWSKPPVNAGASNAPRPTGLLPQLGSAHSPLCSLSARPERFELSTFGSVDRRSIQLSYGRVCAHLLSRGPGVWKGILRTAWSYRSQLAVRACGADQAASRFWIETRVLSSYATIAYSPLAPDRTVRLRRLRLPARRCDLPALPHGMA
jgi:hypothetical protein